MGLKLQARVKKQPLERKHTNSLVKKKLQAQQPVKKVMLTIFWNMKGSISINFLEKGGTVNILPLLIPLEKHT